MTYTQEEANILLNQEYAKKEEKIHKASFQVNDEEEEFEFLDKE